ncbi:nitrilase-related carbon-nitrogen hydrolase [Amycolatopsis magusensis]|uniref:nitrilase-related carbon-nitrogen hydrolase n=1 Tax=Amycolatopsis magusensis TaxID=882444 RepID=UPI0024A9A76C|nr:nitrilase-related carbon-nitrogen hydrolase [Amycolatopsis magusensis]MDI5979969.1 nitrilase-related carbon-nitrogen hydrolase [Amycolatopsis magusensis]
MTVVHCAPVAPVIGDHDGNRRRVLTAIGSAVAAGAQVIVLPELATCGYAFTDVAEARAAGIAADDPLFADWSRAAGPAVVVGGFAELGDDGELYNSAAMVDASGVLAVYRKTHLWDREKLLFRPGDSAPPIVHTGHGRIGLLICYDLEFPEVTRNLAERGAELIAAPVNWPLVDRPDGEHPPETVIAMAAARTNRLCFAICDRSGTERDITWTGGSTTITADGWPQGPIADLDLSLSRNKWLSPHNHALNDRRLSF